MVVEGIRHIWQSEGERAVEHTTKGGIWENEHFVKHSLSHWTSQLSILTWCLWIVIVRWLGTRIMNIYLPGYLESARITQKCKQTKSVSWMFLISHEWFWMGLWLVSCLQSEYQIYLSDVFLSLTALGEVKVFRFYFVGALRCWLLVNVVVPVCFIILMSAGTVGLSWFITWAQQNDLWLENWNLVLTGKMFWGESE